MNTSLAFRVLAAIGVCIGFAPAAVAQDAVVAEPVSNWIFSDRYISSEHVLPNPAPQDAGVAEPVSNWIFSDRYISSEHVVPNPVAQDARVQPTRPQAVRLDLCEPFAPRLLLTAYLFRDFHLELRPPTAEHSSCTVETTAYAVIVGSATQKLGPNEDALVARYWRELMP